MKIICNLKGVVYGLGIMLLVLLAAMQIPLSQTVTTVHTLHLQMSETTSVEQIILLNADGSESVTKSFTSLGRQGLGTKVIVTEINQTLQPLKVCLNNLSQCVALEKNMIVDRWGLTVRAETIYSANLKQDVREPLVSRTSFCFL